MLPLDSLHSSIYDKRRELHRVTKHQTLRSYTKNTTEIQQYTARRLLQHPTPHTRHLYVIYTQATHDGRANSEYASTVVKSRIL